MNLFDEYVAYLKDNPDGYWFKAKLYGIGWMPAKKQGWAVLGMYLLFVLGLVLLAPNMVNDEQAMTHVMVPIFVATALLLAIVLRTGEPLKWHWGRKHGE